MSENQRPYRAKPIDPKLAGEDGFVYGWYIERYDTMAFIINANPTCDADNLVEVIPATVGQQVGLKDKNGKGREAYQGDLIVYQKKNRNSGKPIEIIWEDGSWHGCYVGTEFTYLLNAREMEDAEIIGNKWEAKNG